MAKKNKLKPGKSYVVDPDGTITELNKRPDAEILKTQFVYRVIDALGGVPKKAEY